ncbi:class I SAM-dependent methyltransferase [Streptosporangium canum]|uniref:class I SAM-dependent methyltransferase n=1 Tax=Streptosporangium canum TaxID=324952 RepID=UPI0034350249
MSDTWGEEPLFGIFRKIKKLYPKVPLISFYEGDFHLYLKKAAWPQQWDIGAICKLTRQVGPDTIIELGCGEGRITWNLLQDGFSGRILGIDNSISAEEGFRERFRAEPRAEFALGDITQPPRHSTTADLVVMGNVTVNSFLNDDDVKAVFAHMDRSLTAHGHAIIGVYQDSVPERFTQLSGAMDAVQLTDANGVQRLLWRGVDYQDRDFRQNYFIEYQDSRHPGVLGVLRERIWVSSEIQALAEESGFTLRDVEITAVDQGGANGWPVDALLLQKGS